MIREIARITHQNRKDNDLRLADFTKSRRRTRALEFSADYDVEAQDDELEDDDEFDDYKDFRQKEDD